MIKISKIENNKDEILKKNISPNVYWNRFDIRYKDYDLWKIEDNKNTIFISSSLENNIINVSTYLREISEEIFIEFIKFLFDFYKKAEKIYFLHTYIHIDEDCPYNPETFNDIIKYEHAHIELPNTIEEFRKNLSYRTRYDTNHYPKKIIKDFGNYEIKHWSMKDTPQFIIDKYKKLKLETHKNIDNFAMSISTEVWALFINNEIASILSYSDTEETPNYIFLVNITYNQKFSKYSPANVLLYASICNKIEIGYKVIPLFKMMEYKRHFGAIGTTTYEGYINRYEIIPYKWLVYLSHLPKIFYPIVKFFVRKRYRSVFNRIINIKK